MKLVVSLQINSENKTTFLTNVEFVKHVVFSIYDNFKLRINESEQNPE